MRKTTKSTIRLYFKHVKQFKKLITGMLISLSIEIIAGTLWAIALAKFFDTLSSNSEKKIIIESLIATLIIIILVDMVEWLGWHIFKYINNRFQIKSMRSILNECFEYIHGHSYEFFTNSFTGALVKKVSRAVKSFEHIADRVLFDFYPIFLKLLITIGVLSYLNIWLGIVTVIWVLVFIVINYYLSLYKLKYDLVRAESDTEVTARLADTFTNNVNIKYFSGIKFE